MSQLNVSGRNGRPRATLWQRVLMVAVTGAAIVWILMLLHSSWPTLVTALRQMDVFWLGMALALCVISAGSKGETFYLLLRQISSARLSRKRSYSLEFIAQLARHLPGRFWGVAYQLAELRGQVTGSSLILVQTMLSAAAAFFTVWTAGIILSYSVHPLLAAAILSIGIMVLLAAVPAGHLLARLSGPLSKHGRVGRALSSLLGAFQRVRWVPMLGFYSASTVGWILYVAAWAAFGEAYPGLESKDGLRLVAFYSLAWVLGFLALFTPSGLGVRELAFLGLAAEFPPDVLAVTAILGRLWLTTNDLVLGGFGLLWRSTEDA